MNHRRRQYVSDAEATFYRISRVKVNTQTRKFKATKALDYEQHAQLYLKKNVCIYPRYAGVQKLSTARETAKVRRKGQCGSRVPQPTDKTQGQQNEVSLF